MIMRPRFFILDKIGFFTLNFLYSLCLILFFNLLLFPQNCYKLDFHVSFVAQWT